MEHFEFSTQNLNEKFDTIALQDNLANSSGNHIPDAVTKNEEIDGKIDDDDPPLQTTRTDTTASVEDTFPPKTITLKNDQSPSPPDRHLSYVQLCYDKHQEAIVPVLDISFGGKKRGKIPYSMATPASFPTLSELSRANDNSSSPTRSSATSVSSLTVPDGLVNLPFEQEEIYESDFDPLVLGEDLNIYLLHEHNNGNSQVAVRCSDVLQKILSRPTFPVKRKKKEADFNTKIDFMKCSYKTLQS